MDEPMTNIEAITRSAHQAADTGEPVNVCPYPSEWEAADWWRKAYHARARELRAYATT
jgi:hypothetical protein